LEYPLTIFFFAQESQLLFGNQNAPTEYFVRVIDDEPLQFTEDHFDTAHTEKAGDQLLPEHRYFFFCQKFF